MAGLGSHESAEIRHVKVKGGHLGLRGLRTTSNEAFRPAMQASLSDLTTQVMSYSLARSRSVRTVPPRYPVAPSKSTEVVIVSRV